MTVILRGRRNNLVILECHFSWQAQSLVKFGSIGGARNVVIFSTKCVSESQKATSANGWVRDDEFMLGSCSRIVNDSTVFAKFPFDFECSFAWQVQYLVTLED